MGIVYHPLYTTGMLRLEVSNDPLVSWLILPIFTGRKQPTCIGVIVDLLSSMDILVGKLYPSEI